nr:MAG TPA: protein of unknown function (DUF5055) [Caudoviricetes sp.]
MQINLSYKNKEYTLEYNRQGVTAMEAQGFNISEVSDKPMTRIPQLFYGAFTKNHRGIKRSLVDEIYDNISDKSGLIQALVELYADTLNTLMEDSEGSEGNATWEMKR